METKPNNGNGVVIDTITLNADSSIGIKRGDDTLQLSGKALEEFFKMFGFNTIDQLINLIKDNIIEISTFKIRLKQNYNDLDEEFDVNPSFFFHLKLFLEFLQAVKLDNKHNRTLIHGGE